MSVQARSELLKRVEAAPPDKLRGLLDVVFPFISIPHLQPIVISVLSRSQPVPKGNLHSLAESGDLFWGLPLSVQRQVRLPTGTTA
jgi:hypothetical protein